MADRPGLATRAFEAAYALLARVSRYDAWTQFQALQSNQWRAAGELHAIRWAKARRLLTYAMEQVPFYRDMWTAVGVDPRRFTCIDDLRHLPVTTRAAVLQAQQDDGFLLSRRNDYQMTHSSGTTGPRVYLPFTPADMQVKYANYLREFYVTDWRLGMRSAALHYSGHPEFAGRYTGQPDQDNYVGTRQFVFRVLHNRILYPPYASSESGDDTIVAAWYDALRRRPPFLLETMEFNILALLKYIEDRGLPRLRIPRMFVLATLSDGLRRRLEEAFASEVFNRFGPHEMEGVGFECHEHRGIHLAIDSVHPEFLDEEDRPVGPGEWGRLILTDLDSYTMPLIRYELGDIGSYVDQPCPCGRRFPLMNGIGCRMRDRLVGIDGRPLVPRPLISAAQDDDAVRFVQIAQAPDGSIEVRVVPDAAQWSAGRAATLLERLRTAVPAERDRLRVVTVDRVHLEPNGKFSAVRKWES
ncbi:MAG: phenylacetate--CoA ligase family protein [Acidobacteria bacterium]|nr:phenylacetate--CoA ligase family protein [Acidobacteriota bacterium]